MDESMYQFKNVLVEDVSRMSSSDEKVNGYFVPDSNIMCYAINICSAPFLTAKEIREWLPKITKTLYQPILDEVFGVLNNSVTEKRDAITKEQHESKKTRAIEVFNKVVDTSTTRLILTPRLHEKSSIKHFNSDLSDRLLEEVGRGKIDLVDATLLFLAGVAKPKSMVVSYDRGVNEVAYRHDIPCYDTRISRGRLPVDFTDPWEKRMDSSRPG